MFIFDPDNPEEMLLRDRMKEELEQTRIAHEQKLLILQAAFAKEVAIAQRAYRQQEIDQERDRVKQITEIRKNTARQLEELRALKDKEATNE